MSQKSAIPHDGRDILGAVAGGAIAYLLTTNLHGMFAAVTCAVLIVLMAVGNGKMTHSVLWWASIGVIAGSIIGTGIVLSESIDTKLIAERASLRYTVIGCLAAAGFAGGALLGRQGEAANTSSPEDLVRRATAITAFLFGVVVTFRFPSADSARALSGRMSTMTTILATAIALPGWLGFQLSDRLLRKHRARVAPETSSPTANPLGAGSNRDLPRAG